MRKCNERETMKALETKEAKARENKAVQFARCVYGMGMAASAFSSAAAISATNAFASGGSGAGGSIDAIEVIKNVMTTVGGVVGTGLIIFGVYEIIMAFLQSQPEAKTKGMIMAVCGAVLIGIGALLP